MKSKIVMIGVFLGSLSGAYADNPTLPNSGYTGININIQLQNWEGVTTGGGGEFGGSVTPQSGPASGNTQYTNFWCVDFQEAFSFGQTSLANFTTLAAIGNDPNNPNTQVRYSDVTDGGPPTWLNTGDGLLSDAQSRYEMVAYLVDQYDSSDAVNPSERDDAIQNAIWAITDNTGTSGIYTNGGVYESGDHVLGVTGSGDNQIAPSLATDVNTWVQAAVANYNSVNPLDWAVVSWGALPDGTLGIGPYWDTNEYNDGTNGGARQTFLVELSTGNPIITHSNIGGNPTPEPGLYGALAVGFGGLFFALSRRKRA